MAQRRNKRVGEAEAGDLQMTSMIDIVFLLLIYFIVTIKPVDISAHLDVFKPSADAPPIESKEPPKMIQIQIYPGALLMNGRSMTIQKLGDVLQKLGAISKTQTVVISCDRASEHDKLIQVLDRCAKAKLSSLSVVSMN